LGDPPITWQFRGLAAPQTPPGREAPRSGA